MLEPFIAFFSVLGDTKSDHFIEALGILVTIVLAIWSGIAFGIMKLADFRICRTEKILLEALTEDFLQWVKIHYSSDELNLTALAGWLLSGRVALFGHNYPAFQKLLRVFSKRGIQLTGANKEWFMAQSRQYLGRPQLSRCEW